MSNSVDQVRQEYSGESAHAYNVEKQKPFRVLVEKYTILSLVEQHFGSFKDLRVVDLGCGDGIYSRLAEANGASKVIGIDVTCNTRYDRISGILVYDKGIIYFSTLCSFHNSCFIKCRQLQLKVRISHCKLF